MIYEIVPIQDLHGWGKPWAPGTNKNKVQISTGRLEGSGIIIDSLENGYMHAYGVPNAQLRLEFSVINNYSLPSSSYLHMRNEGIIVAGCGMSFEGANTYTVVFSSLDRIYSLSGRSGKRVASVGISLANNAGIGQPWDIWFRPSVELSDTPGEWTPYANVCMPEGFSMTDGEEDYTVYAGYLNTDTRELLLRPVYESYDGEELTGPWISDIDEYTEDGTPTTGAFVIDLGGDLTSYLLTPYMLQTLMQSLGIVRHFNNGAGLVNLLMDQAQGRVRSEEEMLNRSRALKVIAIGDQLPSGLKFKPISKDVLPGLPGKFIR